MSAVIPEGSTHEWRGMILHVLAHSSTFPSTTENGVLETAEGNYLGPLWNFLRRCSNYSKCRDVETNSYASKLVRFVTRATQVASSSRETRARRMGQRERERYRKGKNRRRERERERAHWLSYGPSDAGLHQTGITHIRFS